MFANMSTSEALVNVQLNTIRKQTSECISAETEKWIAFRSHRRRAMACVRRYSSSSEGPTIS